MPSRADAWDLLCDWTKTDALRRHGLAVEAAVAWYGEHRFGIAGDELEIWRSAGLLHDFDYERYPDTHPLRGADELRARGYREDVVEAILGHGDHTGSPVQRFPRPLSRCCRRGVPFGRVSTWRR